MLRHIVLSRLKPDASEAAIEAWREAIQAMCRDSPHILSWTFGKNVGSGPFHYDYALVADFADRETFRAYIDSPAHKAYVETHARHVNDTLAAIQHEI